MKVRFMILFFLTTYSFSEVIGQTADSLQRPSNFSGWVSVTNNGISLVPAFSLGKPATLIQVRVGRRLSFEPQFRYSLKWEPWSYILWWRYKLVDNEKFKLRIGVNPSIRFVQETVDINGTAQDITAIRQNFTSELAPSFRLSDRVSIGSLYMHAQGIRGNPVSHVEFLALNTRISKIPIGKKLHLEAVPQIFYLNVDGEQGIYATGTLSLEKVGSPFEIQSIMNRIITTEIAGDTFVWNISLIYNFGKKYVAID